MPSQQDQVHFAFLQYVLLSMILIFLASNIAFITGCVSASRTTGADSCKVSDVVESLATVIPAIKRPVVFLEQQGNHKRAELVGSVYSFAWASAIATATAMIFTALAAAALLSHDSTRAFKQPFEQKSRHWTANQRDQIRKAFAFLALIAAWVFWDAFWGNFDFSKSSPLSHFNVVHVSDVDLYRLSILLAGLLLFFILPVILCARAVVLKSSGEQAPHSSPTL
jgi:hypothetical protein